MSTSGNAPGWFDGFRTKPFPTIYGDLKTPVTSDVLYTGWIAAFCTILASFICILPAIKNTSLERFLVFVRVTLFLLLGLVIVLCNFGQEWEVGDVDTHTPYRAGTGQEIYAKVGVKLSLRSVNITLKALEDPSGDLRGETIDYNERFYWTWDQGRAGFGPFAGEMQRSFREAQRRGAPLPILWVAEYFTFDGEGIRFGRYYRTSGWFAHICVWTALPLWLLTILLSKLVITYAALTLALTGAMLLCAALIWASNRNFIEMEVPFTPPEGILRTHFGFHWHLALVVGSLCLVLGILLYLLDTRFHDELSKFFGNNPHQIVEQETTEEVDEKLSSNNMEMGDMNAGPSEPRVVTILRGRGTSKRYSRMVNYPAYSKTTPAYHTPAFTKEVPLSRAPIREDPVLRQRGQGAIEQERHQAQGYPQGYPQAYPQGHPQAYPQPYPQGYPQDYQNLGYQHDPQNQGYGLEYQNQGSVQGAQNIDYVEDYQARGYQAQDEELEEPIYENVLKFAKPDDKPVLPPKGRRF